MLVAGHDDDYVAVSEANLRDVADAMDALWASMREAEEQLRRRTEGDRGDLRAAYGYLFARAGLAAIRCSDLVERGRALRRREVIISITPGGRRDAVRRT